MDAYTVEVMRVLIAATALVMVIAIVAWAAIRIHDGEPVAQWSVAPNDEWHIAYGNPFDFHVDDFLYDEDDADWQDERQELRDRLADALWENRKLRRDLKRRHLDDEVRWKVDELSRKVGSWEGE